MQHLIPYINDPENPQINFDLGLEYERMGQTGAAISFYLRTAERAQEPLLQYEALLRMALCFGLQKTRDDTQKVLLQKAINLCIDRPEAHFLLARAHEKQRQWHEGWTVAALALKICRWDHPGLRTYVEYPGQWGIIFEYGLCAWYVGHTEESRKIMFDLRYSWPLDTAHRIVCENNLRICGWPRLGIPYDRAWAPKIRASFPGLVNIAQNHSQSLQDMFVLTANQGKRNQWYLEVGSAEPFYHNNTALLETNFAWQGISIDIDAAKVQDFKSNRINPVICQDAMALDFQALLRDHGAPRDLGYLQIDCDPPQNSYNILTRMPWQQHRFAVITFEHDFYADQSIRDLSRQFLTSQGYELMASDIAFDSTHSYEDWWVHPELVSQDLRQKLRDIDPGVKPADRYLFNY